MSFWSELRIFCKDKTDSLDAVMDFVEPPLNKALPKIGFTFLLFVGGVAKSLLQMQHEIVVRFMNLWKFLWVVVVLYCGCLSLYCIVQAFSIQASGKKFLYGRIHLLNGTLGTIFAFISSISLLFCNKDDERLMEIPLKTAQLSCLFYFVNVIMAIPLLFLVHAHLAALVRLLATGLFIVVVMALNVGVLITKSKVVLGVHFVFASLSIVFSISEIVLGFQGPGEEKGSVAEGKGPLSALLRKGSRPHKEYFRESIVTRVGFLLGIPPTLAWIFVFYNKTELAGFDQFLVMNATTTSENALLTRESKYFIITMAFECWQGLSIFFF